jgi:DNA-binding response OmpR family regulator
MGKMTAILLIEDVEDLARVVRRELEQDGYRVLWAADGVVGLRMFRSHQPGLVILDWMLPELDGPAVLREMCGSPPVPVLTLTARTDEGDRVIGLEVGALDLLPERTSARRTSR